MSVTGSLDPAGLRADGYNVWWSDAPIASVSANVSSKSALCKKSGNARTCTIPISLPAGGPYQISFALFSVKPVNGKFPPTAKPIGAGIVAQTLTSKGNKIPITTSSEIARAGIAFQPNTIHAIDPAKIVAIVTGYDTAGNAIVSNGFTAGKHRATMAISADGAAKPALAFPAVVNLPANGEIYVSYASSKASPTQIASGFTATLTAKPSGGGTAGSSSISVLQPKGSEASIPTKGSYPEQIIAGPDGAMWFTEFDAGKIGRVTTAMKVTNEYAGFGHPQTIAIGADKALWIANDDGAGGITRLTTTGTKTDYALATNTYPAGINAGPKNALWYGSINDNYISYITTSGMPGAQFALPAGNNYPSYGVMGPNGHEFFTLPGSGKIADVLPTGAIAHIWTVPGTKPSPQNIIVGPDKNLWFGDSYQNVIFRLTTAGVFARHAVGKTIGVEGPLVFGPDGKIWFTGSSGIGRLDPVTGSVFALQLPTQGGGGVGICVGPDGAFYITEVVVNKIARLQ